MAKRETPGPRGFCVELPTERDALKVAQRIADKLAEGRHKARNITVTDEHGSGGKSSSALEALIRDESGQLRLELPFAEALGVSA